MVPDFTNFKDPEFRFIKSVMPLQPESNWVQTMLAVRVDNNPKSPDNSKDLLSSG